MKGEEIMTRENVENIVLPLPPEEGLGMSAMKSEDLEIYTRFIRYHGNVPNSRKVIKVLSAIQFTADILGYSDAHVAKVLIELGLRAPRMAFPASFLEYADAALMRSGWEVGGPSPALLELRDFWNAIGEDRFAGFKRGYSLLDEMRVF